MTDICNHGRENLAVDCPVCGSTGTQLHVYRNGIIEWVVAESAEAAAALLLKHHEGSADPDELDLKFKQEPDDKPLHITEYDGPGGDNQTMTCAEWAKNNGRGFLCSTEY